MVNDLIERLDDWLGGDWLPATVTYTNSLIREAAASLKAAEATVARLDADIDTSERHRVEAEATVTRLTRLVREGYNEGYSEGIREHPRHRWDDSHIKEKLDAALRTEPHK